MACKSCGGGRSLSPRPATPAPAPSPQNSAPAPSPSSTFRTPRPTPGGAQVSNPNTPRKQV